MTSLMTESSANQGLGKGQTYPGESAWQGVKERGHTKVMQTCVFGCVCASHLGHSKGSVAEKVGCHDQGSDRGQVFTIDEEV